MSWLVVTPGKGFQVATKTGRRGVGGRWVERLGSVPAAGHESASNHE